MTVVASAVLGDGAPRVGVTVTGLPGTNSVVSVESSWDEGQTWAPVRGASRVTVVSAMYVTDFVPALNTPVIYRVVIHTGGSVTGGDRATVTVPSDVAWIQDPLNPRGAVPVHSDMEDGRVLLASESLVTALWRQESDVVLTEGARYPVASIGQRMVSSSVPLRLTYEIAQHAGALQRMLSSAGQVVIRGIPDAPLDPVAHVLVGDATENRVYSDDGNVAEWELSVQQVRPTSMRIVVPWWSYADVKALWEAQAASYSWAGTAHASVSTESVGGIVRRSNLVPNPSFETSILGCSVTAGTGGTAAVSRQTSGGYSGSAFLRAAWTVASTAVGYMVLTGPSYRATVTPLGLVRLSAWVRPSVAGSWRLIGVTATTNAGGTTTTVNGTLTSCPADVWTELSLTLTPATGRGFLEVRVGSSGAVPVQTVDADAVLASQDVETGTYFDGSTASAMSYATVASRRPGETYLDWLADPTPEGGV